MAAVEDAASWSNTLTEWHNKPAQEPTIQGAGISIQVPPKTDCWRKTRNNFNRDNAPFFWRTVNGNFSVVCKIFGDFKNFYDKAGLMVRIDEANWVLSGMEFFNQTMNHSTCITKGHTDWSLTPLPPNAEQTGIWFKIQRVGDTVECLYSTDGRTWEQTREASFGSQKELQVGICGGSPIGRGFEATWQFFRCQNI